MREVSIHLEEYIVAALQSPAKAGEVGSAKPKLSGSVDHVDPWLALRDLFCDFAGSVGRSIINYENFESGILRENGRHKTGEIVSLIIRRYDDQGVVFQACNSSSRLNCGSWKGILIFFR